MRCCHASTVALLVVLTIPAASLAQPARRTAQQKMADAMSAAPASLTAKATIMDWPEKEGAEPKQLRAGTNGWVCYPTTPAAFESASGRDPMCLDEEWQSWATAWVNKDKPQIKKVGVAYMLRGDVGSSNTDPFATKPTPDNQWTVSGPHIMIVVPDPTTLDGMPTDPDNGGPWVMFKGTPYAHIMVPIAPKQGRRASEQK